MDQQQNSELFNMNLSPEAKSHLGEAARWARFLAICGMIFIVLLVIAGAYIALVVTTATSQFDNYRSSGVSAQGMGATVVIMYVLVGLLYFFPCLFLLQFANKMRLALMSNDDLLLSESFRSLKKTFRYIGVLMIIGLLFFLLGLISGGLTNSFNR